MPIIKSAIKAARQTKKRTAHNQNIKKAIRTALKAFKAKPSAETLRKAQSEYDKAVKKDLIHKNTAARRKSVLVKMAKMAEVKPAAAKKAEKPATEKKTVKTAKPATKKPSTKTAAKKPIAK